MTKKDIIKSIADRIGLTQVQTRQVVQGTFDAIIDTLAREGKIQLRNFGVFEVKTRKARKARNPKTGEEVSVPEKRVVVFKPGREMSQVIR